MKADEFRAIALGLSGATESAHRDHPDFRVKKKIFATLGSPDAGWGMVELTPEQQEILVGAEPGVFKPAAGAWGRGGSTLARLEHLDEVTARSAIRLAWENAVSK